MFVLLLSHQGNPLPFGGKAKKEEVNLCDLLHTSHGTPCIFAVNIKNVAKTYMTQ